MKLAVYEFEVFRSEGFYIAEPYDMEGGTMGETYEELCEMVADWLRGEVEYRDVHGIELPTPTFGNAPRHGGANLVSTVAAGRETVEKVSAAEAARMLGVTPPRVTHMLASNLLEGWREGRNTYVTVDSLNARLADHPRVGRPAAMTA